MNTVIRFLLLIFVFSMSSMTIAEKAQDKVRLGVVGLTHTHVHWIFESEKRGDFEIVGIVEPNRDLALRYSKQHRFSMKKVYDTMDEMLRKSKPEGVTAFGTIYDHLSVVEKAAPLGIHVMVEKPLAVSLAHAKKMNALAERHNIHLLTNYETTWYPTNHKAHELVKAGKIGDIRKVVVHDGHKGPAKLGINKEFLEWLTDPVQNGGGAIIDFGCYGANLMTWLRDNEKPISVTAVTQQFQPENNPKVDDEATIILTYPDAQAVIQASWNWPIGRKDMQIYGLTGMIDAKNRHQISLRLAQGYDGFDEKNWTLEEREAPLDDPFSMFSSIIRGKLTLNEHDLSGLQNNMIVMEILDAAVESAKTGKTIFLQQ